MKVTNVEFEVVNNSPSLTLIGDDSKYCISWQTDIYQLFISTDCFVYFSELMYNSTDKRIDFMKNSDLVGILDISGTSDEIISLIIDHISRM